MLLNLRRLINFQGLVLVLLVGLSCASENRNSSETAGVDAIGMDVLGLPSEVDISRYIERDGSETPVLRVTIFQRANVERLDSLAQQAHNRDTVIPGIEVSKTASSPNDSIQTPFTVKLHASRLFTENFEVGRRSTMLLREWLMGSGGEDGFLSKPSQERYEEGIEKGTRVSFIKERGQHYKFTRTFDLVSSVEEIHGKRHIGAIGEVKWIVTIRTSQWWHRLADHESELEFRQSFENSGLVIFNALRGAVSDPWPSYIDLFFDYERGSSPARQQYLIVSNVCFSESGRNDGADEYKEKFIDYAEAGGTEFEFVVLRRAGDALRFARSTGRLFNALGTSRRWTDVLGAFSEDDEVNATYDRTFDRQELARPVAHYLLPEQTTSYANIGAGLSDSGSLVTPFEQDFPSDPDLPDSGGETPDQDDPDLPDSGGETPDKDDPDSGGEDPTQDDPDLPDTGGISPSPDEPDLPDSGGDALPVPEPPPPLPDDGGRDDDPLVIDLDGDGEFLPKSLALQQGSVRFDLDGDGIAEKRRWISGGDGFLAIDRNGNGVIDSGRELFRDRMPISDLGLSRHGFEHLAEWDSNSDGEIDTDDAIFNYLVVWIDRNLDGFSSPGEVFPASEFLHSLSLQALDLRGSSPQLAPGRQSYLRLIGRYAGAGIQPNGLTGNVILPAGHNFATAAAEITR